MNGEETKPKPSTLDEILARLDRPDVAEKRERLAEIVGLDSDMMEATLLHLFADLLPMSSKTAAKLRGRANYDLCKFACRQGAKLGEKRAEKVAIEPSAAQETTKTTKTTKTTQMKKTATTPMSLHTWLANQKGR